jgi:excinuclease ABC subunit C
MVSTFIRQYYQTTPFIPEEILIPNDIEDHQLIEEWLKQLKGKTVRIHRPHRGEKARLLAIAKENADKELDDRIIAASAERDILNRLQKRLKLQRFPHRIECFDNSNISGTDSVAAMVVFENSKPKKSDYRKYRIQTVDIHDDYAYMAEVLNRRFSKSENESPYPDLLIVDGGKGQLNIALAILKALDCSNRFDVIGIAKKNEKKGETEDKVYKPGRSNPVNFGREGELLLLMQRVRDEAHRFAITFHRQRRKKRTLHSVLDTIPGIGRKRKEMLLQHFGSIQKIRAATFEELSVLPGINRTVAEALKAGLSK